MKMHNMIEVREPRSAELIVPGRGFAGMGIRIPVASEIETFLMHRRARGLSAHPMQS